MRDLSQIRPMEMLNKVPPGHDFFWIIKVLATTVGETFADFLSTKLKLGLVTTSYVMTALFLVALIVQVRRTKYVPSVYWTVVVLIRFRQSARSARCRPSDILASLRGHFHNRFCAVVV